MAATWIQRRCPHCRSIRAAQIVDPGEMVPYGAEIISVEEARKDNWAHAADCPERKPTQLKLAEKVRA